MNVILIVHEVLNLLFTTFWWKETGKNALMPLLSISCYGAVTQGH